MSHEILKPTPQGWQYKWENNAVYISNDGGETWVLYMYFPPREPKQSS